MLGPNQGRYRSRRSFFGCGVFNYLLVVVVVLAWLRVDSVVFVWSVRVGGRWAPARSVRKAPAGVFSLFCGLWGALLL